MPSTKDQLTAARARIIVALDLPTPSEARELAQRLAHRPGLFKVGAQLFTAAGPEMVRWLVDRRERVFLDLKFHDIPHIVAEACVRAAELGASLLTVHTSGGPKMLAAARKALEKHAGSQRPRLLGVTVLTSLSRDEARRIGFAGTVERNVVRLARMAKASGCDGVIAAPTDVAAVRRACGSRFLIITPGVHLSGGPKAPDQARVATAADSIRAGADKVVVGRAVYAALSPVRAFDQLAWEVAAALR